jgi:hypothetical protein
MREPSGGPKTYSGRRGSHREVRIPTACDDGDTGGSIDLQTVTRGRREVRRPTAGDEGPSGVEAG